MTERNFSFSVFISRVLLVYHAEGVGNNLLRKTLFESNGFNSLAKLEEYLPIKGWEGGRLVSIVKDIALCVLAKGINSRRSWLEQRWLGEEIKAF